MAQLYLKGVYFDTESEGLWYIDNAGSYQEISVSATTIYTGDGTLSEDRVINLDGHNFTIEEEEGERQLQIDNTPALKSITVAIYDDTTTVNGSQLIITGTDVDCGFDLRSVFDDDGATVITEIQAASTATTSTINYKAYKHTFTGDAILADLTGGGTTGASIDNTGKLIRTP